jgi:hypothetical protein
MSRPADHTAGARSGGRRDGSAKSRRVGWVKDRRAACETTRKFTTSVANTCEAAILVQKAATQGQAQRPSTLSCPIRIADIETDVRMAALYPEVLSVSEIVASWRFADGID